MQRHHLRPPILRRQRRIRPYRLHLRTRLRKDLPHLRRLAVIQIQPPLHLLDSPLRIHVTWSLHLPIRRWPLLLLIRRRRRRRLLLRNRRAQTQPGTAQHHNCCTKHPACSKVLHSLYPALSKHRRFLLQRCRHQYKRSFPQNVLPTRRDSFAETFSTRQRLRPTPILRSRPGEV
jgi:hypothetical protein